MPCPQGVVAVRVRSAIAPGRRLLPLLLLALGLGGCAPSDLDDLEQYSREVLARPGGRIEPLPVLKPYDRYLYQAMADGARDPFEPFFTEQAKEASKAPVIDAKQQQLIAEMNTRNREDLENHELDSLRMVGTLQDAKELWGIILDRTGTVHRVKVGNYMGKNFGKILTISEDKIDLREIIEDGQGGYEERAASVALTEQ